MEISVLIIEDNPITAQDLSEILAENGLKVAGICYSAEDALERIPGLNPDVLLVDIKLHGEMTGIDLVNQLRVPVPVIYLTSNSDRETVNQALETHPSSFLTKPFDEKDVIIAIELAFKSFNDQEVKAKNHASYVFLKTGIQYEKVGLAEIHYMEADGSYCRVVTSNKEYLLSGNMTHFCAKVDQNIIKRIHRSFAVNVNHIVSIGSDSLSVLDRKLPVGRTYKDELRDLTRRFS